MYYCNDCKKEFIKPLKNYETHGLTSPPYEVFLLCPFCKSTNFKEKEIKYCRCCGARLSNPKAEYCSDKCKISLEKLRREEYKRHKMLSESPLIQLIKEVEAYNKQNGTKYSYGQYVALIKPRNKGKKK